MKNFLQKLSLISTLVILCFSNNFSQENYNKSKPDLEKGKITIKVKEGIGPFQKQTGTISFGIYSLDQKSAKYKVNKLKERFVHNPIPKNSNLPDLSRIYQIEFPTKYNVVNVSQEFSEDPNIEYAEPVPVNYLMEVPNDGLYNQQWYLHKIQSELAWHIHKGEDGDSTIILAITDTGIDWDHPDLVNNLWNNLGEDTDNDGHTIEWNGTSWVFDPGDINNIDDDGNGFIDDFIGWNFLQNSNNPNDSEGHGTWVAGIAAGVTNNDIGIASISYNLEVMPIKEGEYNGVIYAAENGADVINCSWGNPDFSQANKEVIEYVDGLGSIVVAAAGNSNNSDAFYPACYPYVISVAGLDSQNVKLPYTTYGAGVDVSAPGPQSFQPFITTYLNGVYGNVTLGTSFSSPIVTGLVGLIKSYHPTWTRDKLVEQLLYTTDSINSINPEFENLLGTGKINAYHALLDSGLTITPELKINMALSFNTIKEGSKILCPNSFMNFSLRVQNYSHFLDANHLIITMTTNNPDVQIIDGDYSGSVAANSAVELVDEFQIQIAPNAVTAIATLTFTASATLPIVAGSVFEINLIINPGGSLVWEGVENGQDYSGEFIKNYLTSNSYPVLYTTESVISYNGLDALFLSFGNYGSSGSTNTFFTTYHAALVQDYLESGGKVYIEGGDALGWDQSGNSYLYSLFGLSNVNDGANNIINSLEGQNAALTLGMLFTSSTQVSNFWIDIYNPNANGSVAFYESGYGNVAVQSTGTYGQRTFCFSYALSELVDGNPPSTRDTLIQRILDFFDIEPLPATFPLTVSVTDGWNMVSIPGLHPTNQDVTTWWSNLTGSVFKFSGGYLPVTTAATGEGYWMKNAGAETYDYPAIEIVAHDPIPALTGWNMIGGYENSAAVSGLTTTPPGLISGSVFGYSGGYVTATDLVPGYGYWIKLDSAGLINIPPETLSKGSGEVVEYFKEDWGKITITDNTGRSYTLYAVNGEVNLNNYELPPLPPGGMFDIRYGSGRIAEDINSSIQSIEMSGIEYPVIVKVENMDIRLQDETGKKINENIKSGGQITISNAQLNKLMVSGSGIGEMIPDEYALEQNYPNPFNPNTIIKFALPQDSKVNLTVFNILGEKVVQLADQEMKAGYHQIEFDASYYASGIYLYSITAGEFIDVKKMVLMK